MITHFDVSPEFSPNLTGEKYPFSLQVNNFKKIKNLKDIKIITIKSTSKINKTILQKIPHLKAIITRTVGVDHIDIDACKRKKIAVYHIPDYGAFAIAEHVFALLLSQTRKILPLSEKTKNGRFAYQDGQGYSLKDKTMGIIGVGKTGKEVAKIAQGFQMKVLGYDQKKDYKFAQKFNIKYVSLKTLLGNSDIITLNIPLTRKTKHLIDTKTIKLMKKKTILINVSRGEIINTQALMKDIHKFKYICLDVLEDEKNFSIKNPLLKYDKVLITPHCAFFTDLTTQNILRTTNQNIANFLSHINENKVV